MPEILPQISSTLPLAPNRRRRVLRLVALIVLLQAVAIFWAKHPDRFDSPAPRHGASDHPEARDSLPVVPGPDDPTPLISAVRAGQTVSVQRLLAEGVNVHQIDRQAHTALLIAVESGREDIVRMLLAHRAGERDLRGPRWGVAQAAPNAPKGNSPRAPVRQTVPRNREQTFLPPLVVAAKYGSPALMQHLLGRRRAALYVRECDGNGATALHYAVRLSSPETNQQFTELLIQHGAEVDARDHTGRTPLMQARSLATLNMLIAHGANVNARDSMGNTVLMQNSSPRIAAVLIAHGADVNAQNRRGDTPLLTAIRSSDTEAVAYLLQQGARPDIVNQMGETPLFAAHATRYAPMITLLINAGAKR